MFCCNNRRGIFHMICIQNILSASKRRIYKYSVFCLRSFCITELALVTPISNVLKSIESPFVNAPSKARFSFGNGRSIATAISWDAIAPSSECSSDLVFVGLHESANRRTKRLLCLKSEYRKIPPRLPSLSENFAFL